MQIPNDGRVSDVAQRSFFSTSSPPKVVGYRQPSALSVFLLTHPPLPLTDQNKAFSQICTTQSYHPASSDALPASTLPLP